MVRDRKFLSTEGLYKVVYWFSKLNYLTFGDLERSRPLSDISEDEYLAKWCEIESSCKQKMVMKLLIGFLEKLKYLTFR